MKRDDAITVPNRLQRPSRFVRFSILLIVALGLLVFGPAPLVGAHASRFNAGKVLLVTDYGAQPNDNQDDTVGIQAALNAATAGDTVQLPAGTYLISAQLNVPISGIALKGVGLDKTILKFVGGSATNVENAFIRIVNLSLIEVADMALDGNMTGTIQFGIEAESSDHLNLHGLAIRNFAPVLDPNKGFAPMGIYFSYKVTDSTIHNNIITNIGVNATWGSGIRFADASARNTILYNYVDTTGRGGIFCSGNPDGSAISSDNLIRFNVVRNSGVPNPGARGVGLGIEVWHRCDRTVVEDNIVDHWISDGAPLNAVRRNIVSNKGNSESDQSKDTAFLALEWGEHSDGVYTDNYVDGGAQVGFEISGGPSQYLEFSHNTLKHNVQWGAQIFGNDDATRNKYVYFYQDTFADTYKGLSYAAWPGYDGHGFRIQKYVDHVTLDNVTIDHNPGIGIQLDDPPTIDQMSVINSTITNNGGAAITPYNSYHDLEWRNNTVSGNGDNSIPTPVGFSDQKPTAAFSSPLVVHKGQAMQFTNRSSDPDGTIAHSLWNFGEGAPTTDTDPTFTYPQAGLYRVALTVWDNAGRGAHVERWIVVL